MLRRSLPALALAVILAPAAYAQRTLPQPGYLILRVVLESGGNDPAGGLPGGGRPGLSGSSGGPSGSGGFPSSSGSSGDYPGSGGFPSSGGPPGAGGATAGGPKTDPTNSVVVVVPYENHGRVALYPNKAGAGAEYNPIMETVKTEYGTTPVYNDKSSIQAYWLKPGFSLEGQIKAKHHDWEKAKIPQGGYNLTAEALSSGLTELALQYADETIKAAEGAKDVSPAVAAFVKAYKPLLAKMGEGSEANPEAAWLQAKLRAAGYSQSDHFTLLHFGDTAVSNAVITRRLALLEANLKAFYLFYAIEGVSLPLPQRKLLVLLAPTTAKFFEFHNALDGGPVVADGFYAGQWNLVVLSPERLDAAGRTFNTYARVRFRSGVNPDELVAGNAPKPQQGGSAAEIIELMTLALVQRQVNEDAAVAAVTREGTKQLFAAAGLLNPHISPPRWLEEGVGSFLQTPKGPVYTQDKDAPLKMTVGLARGFGSPNFEMSRRFKEMVTRKELNPDSSAVLLNTLGDKYFDAARKGEDIDPAARDGAPKGIGAGTSSASAGGNGGRFGGSGGLGGYPGSSGGYPRSSSGYPGSSGGLPGDGGYGSTPGATTLPGQPDPAAEARELKERLDTKAQVFAWGLTYYLSKRKPDQFRAFLDDLNHKPRDMRLDPITVRVAFGQAFGLAEKADPTRLDPEAVKLFANQWLAFLKAQPAGVELTVEQSSDPNSGGIDPGFGGGAPGFGGSGEGRN